MMLYKNSSLASQTNASHDGDYSQYQEQPVNPVIAKIIATDRPIENHSDNKRNSLSNLKPDISHLEQEMSQAQTHGHTPSQFNRTPPPYRSSAKRRKVSDELPSFKSHEKHQGPLPKLDLAAIAVKTPSKNIFREDELRTQALKAELASLRAQRNELCSTFV